jgi:mannose-6-phosphate isomerase-like protein (cupin superfamily)
LLHANILPTLFGNLIIPQLQMPDPWSDRMKIKPNTTVEKHYLPGLEHQTLVGAADCVADTEIWMQTLDADAETPTHQHDCDEVVVVNRGKGVCHTSDNEISFDADSTLIIPAGTIHKICNTGEETMHLIATFNATPAKVMTPEGNPINLPWS